MKRPRATLLLTLVLATAALPGCYREVVSAKGLGAAAYQKDIGKGGNYSGLSFDDATQEGQRRYSAPGMSNAAPIAPPRE